VVYHNELDTHLKYEFLTLLYSGTKKPPLETLFRSFVDQTISFFEIGFDWYDSTGKKNTIKEMFLLCCQFPSQSNVLQPNTI
jgi:hypothetical protein